MRSRPASLSRQVNAANSLFNLGRYDEGMKMADLVMSMRPDRGIANLRWIRAHLQNDPREPKFREEAVKYAQPDNVLQIEMALAIWDGRMADYAAAERKLVELFRSNKREDALASLEGNHAINLGLLEGGAAPESLKKATAAPGRRASVRAPGGESHWPWPAIVSVLRRELPRFERDEHLAPGAAPPSGLVTAPRVCAGC